MKKQIAFQITNQQRCSLNIGINKRKRISVDITSERKSKKLKANPLTVCIENIKKTLFKQYYFNSYCSKLPNELIAHILNFSGHSFLYQNNNTKLIINSKTLLKTGIYKILHKQTTPNLKDYLFQSLQQCWYKKKLSIIIELRQLPRFDDDQIKQIKHLFYKYKKDLPKYLSLAQENNFTITNYKSKVICFLLLFFKYPPNDTKYIQSLLSRLSIIKNLESCMLSLNHTFLSCNEKLNKINDQTQKLALININQLVLKIYKKIIL
ncbi:hypothetical protein DID75_04540 [Candidatus Marinamargulisbacteria bacterium SCGC AG-410-N11]|nr:hypothetical protein DID75_04540 [Candidatus Marinamargulisbacteria bacterium SCGC AG-410-N11]